MGLVERLGCCVERGFRVGELEVVRHLVVLDLFRVERDMVIIFDHETGKCRAVPHVNWRFFVIEEEEKNGTEV